MKKLFVAALFMAALLGSCTTESGVTTCISGRFVGSNVDSVYLERVDDMFAAPEQVAGIALADNGAFDFELMLEEQTSPRFYKLSFSGDTRPVTLVVAPGDDIRLEAAGDIFLNYIVEGSEESALIREFNRSYFTPCDKLARLAEKITSGSATLSNAELSAYRLAQEAMQAQLSFVGSNQGRLASFYALRHNVAEQYIPQLSGYGISIVHYRSLLDALSKRYPESPYLAILEREIAEMEAINELSERVEVISYPDMELEDIYKKKHRLSALEDRVVFLNFWSANVALCNNLNAELKELYERYSDKGFEVYQVSIDSNKALWVEAVRQQRHPWISVYGGENPEVLATYNLTTLPTSYLIDKQGNIEVCEYDLKGLEERLKKLL